jgi:hypothetical protein
MFLPCGTLNNKNLYPFVPQKTNYFEKPSASKKKTLLQGDKLLDWLVSCSVYWILTMVCCVHRSHFQERHSCQSEDRWAPRSVHGTKGQWETRGSPPSLSETLRHIFTVTLVTQSSALTVATVNNNSWLCTTVTTLLFSSHAISQLGNKFYKDIVSVI